jgi:H+/gluconate symporter-like permease
MTFGKDMLTMAKYTAGGATAAGVAVAAASTSIPAMAEGGIVNTPTLALIGEKGPEAVVPLAEGAGANTLTAAQNKTNKLLAAIVGLSEKQVNRLADIGTS